MALPSLASLRRRQLSRSGREPCSRERCTWIGVSRKEPEMIQRTALLTLVAAAALVVAGVAHAKGPSKASVTGPGLNGPLAFAGSGEEGGSSPLGRLAEDAGVFPAGLREGHNPKRGGAP